MTSSTISSGYYIWKLCNLLDNILLQATVDMADLVGIYLVMSRVSGKGSVKVLIAGLGWAFAELVLTRLVTLKV